MVAFLVVESFPFVHFPWMAISSLKVEKMGVAWRGNSSKTSSPAGCEGGDESIPQRPCALETHCSH